MREKKKNFHEISLFSFFPFLSLSSGSVNSWGIDKYKSIQISNSDNENFNFYFYLKIKKEKEKM